MKLVEPGGGDTDFAGRSFVFTNDESLEEYQPMVRGLIAAGEQEGSWSGTQQPEEVAEVIWEATNDETARMRFISGEGARQLLGRRYTPEDDEAFLAGLRQQFGLE